MVPSLIGGGRLLENFGVLDWRLFIGGGRLWRFDFINLFFYT